jgi:hypothetical protein
VLNLIYKNSSCSKLLLESAIQTAFEGSPPKLNERLPIFVRTVRTSGIDHDKGKNIVSKLLMKTVHKKNKPETSYYIKKYRVNRGAVLQNGASINPLLFYDARVNI